MAALTAGHDPEVKNHLLFRLSQPGTLLLVFVFVFFFLTVFLRFTFHRIYSSKTQVSLVFNILTESYNHYHDSLSLGHFHHPQKTLHAP